MPESFIRAEGGDKELAAKRWNATMAWRRIEEMDGLLQENVMEDDPCALRRGLNGSYRVLAPLKDISLTTEKANCSTESCVSLQPLSFDASNAAPTVKNQRQRRRRTSAEEHKSLHHKRNKAIEHESIENNKISVGNGVLRLALTNPRYSLVSHFSMRRLKQGYLCYFKGRSAESENSKGGNPILWHFPGRSGPTLNALWRAGLTVREMARHLLFLVEFGLKVLPDLLPNVYRDQTVSKLSSNEPIQRQISERRSRQILTIIDVGTGSNKGKNYFSSSLTIKTAQLMREIFEAHYVGRGEGLVIVNLPETPETIDPELGLPRFAGTFWWDIIVEAIWGDPNKPPFSIDRSSIAKLTRSDLDPSELALLSAYEESSGTTIPIPVGLPMQKTKVEGIQFSLLQKSISDNIKSKGKILNGKKWFSCARRQKDRSGKNALSNDTEELSEDITPQQISEASMNGPAVSVDLAPHEKYPWLLARRPTLPSYVKLFGTDYATDQEFLRLLDIDSFFDEKSKSQINVRASHDVDAIVAAVSYGGSTRQKSSQNSQKTGKKSPKRMFSTGNCITADAFTPSTSSAAAKAAVARQTNGFMDSREELTFWGWLADGQIMPSAKSVEEAKGGESLGCKEEEKNWNSSVHYKTDASSPGVYRDLWDTPSLIGVDAAEEVRKTEDYRKALVSSYSSSALDGETASGSNLRKSKGGAVSSSNGSEETCSDVSAKSIHREATVQEQTTFARGWLSVRCDALSFQGADHSMQWQRCFGVVDAKHGALLLLPLDAHFDGTAEEALTLIKRHIEGDTLEGRGERDSKTENPRLPLERLEVDAISGAALADDLNAAYEIGANPTTNEDQTDKLRTAIYKPYFRIFYEGQLWIFRVDRSAPAATKGVAANGTSNESAIMEEIETLTLSSEVWLESLEKNSELRQKISGGEAYEELERQRRVNERRFNRRREEPLDSEVADLDDDEDDDERAFIHWGDEQNQGDENYEYDLDDDTEPIEMDELDEEKQAFDGENNEDIDVGVDFRRPPPLLIRPYDQTLSLGHNISSKDSHSELLFLAALSPPPVPSRYPLAEIFDFELPLLPCHGSNVSRLSASSSSSSSNSSPPSPLSHRGVSTSTPSRGIHSGRSGTTQNFAANSASAVTVSSTAGPTAAHIASTARIHDGSEGDIGPVHLCGMIVFCRRKYIRQDDELRVAAVAEGSAADSAGLRNGDIIVAVDGIKNDLGRMINKLRDIAMYFPPPQHSSSESPSSTDCTPPGLPMSNKATSLRTPTNSSSAASDVTSSSSFFLSSSSSIVTASASTNSLTNAGNTPKRKPPPPPSSQRYLRGSTRERSDFQSPSKNSSPVPSYAASADIIPGSGLSATGPSSASSTTIGRSPSSSTGGRQLRSRSSSSVTRPSFKRGRGASPSMRGRGGSGGSSAPFLRANSGCASSSSNTAAHPKTLRLRVWRLLRWNRLQGEKSPAANNEVIDIDIGGGDTGMPSEYRQYMARDEWAVRNGKDVCISIDAETRGMHVQQVDEVCIYSLQVSVFINLIFHY